MDGLLIVLLPSLAGIFWQLLFPYKPPKDTNVLKIQQNKRKYDKYENWSIVWLFLSVGYIMGCVLGLGVKLYDIILFFFDYDYIIAPTNTFWAFPGLILGFGLIRIPMEFVYKLMLKEEYYLYTQYTNMKHGFDGEKLWRWFEAILTISGIAIFCLGLNWYVRIDKSGMIEINDLWSVETITYPITDITEISHYNKYITDEGKEKDWNYYTIKMKDGNSFNTLTYRVFASKNDEKELHVKFEELSHLTGIKIILP